MAKSLRGSEHVHSGLGSSVPFRELARHSAQPVVVCSHHLRYSAASLALAVARAWVCGLCFREQSAPPAYGRDYAFQLSLGVDALKLISEDNLKCFVEESHFCKRLSSPCPHHLDAMFQ